MDDPRCDDGREREDGRERVYDPRDPAEHDPGVEKVSGELFTIVHKPGRVGAVTD
jgi:hypothetical protein